MVLHNPNNWHWVNKDVTVWTKTWFEENVTTIEVEKDNVKANISKVVSMEGDVDVSQRKGKVITIFDVKLVLEYSGSAPDADDVTGTIIIPEVAHDTDEDEYVFEINIHSDAKEKSPVKELVRTELVPKLRAVFQTLVPALIKEHGKDIQHAPGTNPSRGFTPAKVHPQTVGAKVGPTTTSAKETKGAIVNTTTVTDNQELRTTAEELYKTFTDVQRVSAFTRAVPKVWEGAHKGGKFEIFDGNVAGEFVELQEGKMIVQSWRLKQWPAGHHSTLEIVFDQNDMDHVTMMRVIWKGVPIGEEDATRRNWQEYYVRSIKQTFGFGTIL